MAELTSSTAALLHHALLLDRRSPLEEPVGRLGAPSRGHEYVDVLAELIDRPVDVAPPAGDLHIRLVHIPPVPDSGGEKVVLGVDTHKNTHVAAVLTPDLCGGPRACGTQARAIRNRAYVGMSTLRA